MILARLVLFAALNVAVSQAAWADYKQRPFRPITSALATYRVAITTGFFGADVVLFGATSQPGDIVVVARGPLANHTVRRKSRHGLLWISGRAVVLKGVPTSYYVASNRPLRDILPQDALRRYQIGPQWLALAAVVRDGAALPSAEESLAFENAFIRLKQAKGLYTSVANDAIVRPGNHLFYVKLHFPASAPMGFYRVTSYLVRSGTVVSKEVSSLVINRSGVEARLFNFASTHAVLYGILSVAVAIAIGGLAGILLRRS